MGHSSTFYLKSFFKVTTAHYNASLDRCRELACSGVSPTHTLPESSTLVIIISRTKAAWGLKPTAGITPKQPSVTPVPDFMVPGSMLAQQSNDFYITTCLFNHCQAGGGGHNDLEKGSGLDAF